MHSVGIFEVCCRSKSLESDGFDFGDRTAPFLDKIRRLRAFALESDAPVVFSTCCSAPMLTKEDPRGALVVPMDPHDTDWRRSLSSHRFINLEKTTWGAPDENDLHRAWDMFSHNPNGERLLDELGVVHWIVYGVGIELCVNAAAVGLLRAGRRVTVLTDMLSNSEGGDRESMDRTLRKLEEMGGESRSMEELLAELGRGGHAR